MSQTSSAHFIMQMRLSGAAQISPPFEIGCRCLLFLFFPFLFSLPLGCEQKGFVVLGWQLESRGAGETGEWGDPQTLCIFFVLFFAEDRGGEMNTGCLILSLSKLLGRVWPGEVSLGLGMGASGIGRGTQKPLSLGAVAAAANR